MNCKTILLTLIAFAFAGINAEIIRPFGHVTLIDEIDCTNTSPAYRNARHFVEHPIGGSKVENILGQPCLTMPMHAKDTTFVKYRIGEGKGLKANGNYLLVVEYPEDVSRSWIVHNKATGSKRGFYTGECLGDAWYPKYVSCNSESLDLPLSGKYEKWTALTTLQDRFGDYTESNGIAHVPADGFDVVIGQYSQYSEPLSAGFAVKRIAIYEVNNFDSVKAKIHLPPNNLPQRHLSWREEMSDGVIGGEPGKRAVENPLDWFDQKARQMLFLGMNTYTKDLFEFGAVQHWDPNSFKPNWMWDGPNRGLWEKIVELMGTYGFWVFPYYEFGGPLGGDRVVNGKKVKSLGYQKRARPLGVDPKTGKDLENYTHVWWVEKCNIDITDPEAIEDFKDVITASVIRYKEKANFMGIWLRPRMQIPIGFAKETVERYNRETGDHASRESLRKNKQQREKYIAWWKVKRAAFMNEMRNHMLASGLKSPIMLFQTAGSEPGPGVSGEWCAFTDENNKQKWVDLWKAPPYNNSKAIARSPKDIASQHLYLTQLQKDASSWGHWEWHHCSPGDDPYNYQKLKGVFLSHPIHRLFSAYDPKSFSEYTNADGGQMLVRHHSLNENMNYKIVMKDGKEAEERVFGYAICDFERAGRACMATEVTAMANGNPYFIGYLYGSTFSRGFPIPVREFNTNYLALPAVPSEIVRGACADPEVVVRRYKTPSNGTYYAIIHTGRVPKKQVKINFPEDVQNLTIINTGRKISRNKIAIDLKPWQLLSLHSDK